MNSFQQLYEDFNNWRNPINANQSGPDIVNFRQQATPAGFKGAQGLTWQGGQEQVSVKVPKATRKQRLSKLLKRLKKINESRSSRVIKIQEQSESIDPDLPDKKNEGPRGFSRTNSIANLGFYKRDPSRDVELANVKHPPEVRRTLDIILTCFNEIQSQKRAQLVFNLMVPYIQDFEYFRKVLVQHERALVELERLRARVEKLNEKAAAHPGENNDIMLKIKKLEEIIEKRESEEAEMDALEAQLSEQLETDRPDLQADIINQIVDLCRDSKSLASVCTTTSHQEVEQCIRDAFERYSTLIYGRRENARGGLMRSYLLLDPIVSFMRFYNNSVMIYQSRLERDKERAIRIPTSTGTRGKNILNDQPELKILSFLAKCIAGVVSTTDSHKRSEFVEFTKKSAEALKKQIKSPEMKIKLQYLIGNFLSGKEKAEGELKRFLVTDVRRHLLNS